MRTIMLGVESSCDETAAAVVADGRDVFSSIVSSQVDLHARFGGVVPELASRAHIEAVNTVIAQAMQKASVGRDDITAVAVTSHPGLIGSLLVGLMAAKSIAWAWGKPLVGVNHVYAHAYAAALDAEPIEYPAVAMVCSGGHTALYRCGGPMEMVLMGTTIDDAVGEAFDKVASILDLGFPGGPAIDKAAPTGNPDAIRFPRTLLHGDSLDFSFSGLKTAVLYHVRGVPGALDEARRAGGEFFKSDVAASFQAAAIDVLRIKIRRAVRMTGAKTIIIGGGVAANSMLRKMAGELAPKLGCTLRLPPMKFCVDNAAMIAGLGMHYLNAGKLADFELDATATVKI